MKYAFPLILLASPAAAHPGAPLHLHGPDTWLLGVAMLTIGLASFVAIWGRK